MRSMRHSKVAHAGLSRAARVGQRERESVREREDKMPRLVRCLRVCVPVPTHTVHRSSSMNSRVARLTSRSGPSRLAAL